MDDLTEHGLIVRGLIVLGGPLEADPGHAAGLLEIVGVGRWTVLLGSSRLENRR